MSLPKRKLWITNVYVSSYLLPDIKYYSRYRFKLSNIPRIKRWPKLLHVILVEEIYVLPVVHTWKDRFLIFLIFCKSLLYSINVVTMTIEIWVLVKCLMDFVVFEACWKGHIFLLCYCVFFPSTKSELANVVVFTKVRTLCTPVTKLELLSQLLLLLKFLWTHIFRYWLPLFLHT